MSPVLYRETEAGRHRRQGRQVQKEIQYGIILRSGLAKPASLRAAALPSPARADRRVRGPVRAPVRPVLRPRTAHGTSGPPGISPRTPAPPPAAFPCTVCLCAGASGAPVFPACIRALPRRPFRPPLQTAFSRAADPRLGRVRIPFGASGRLHIGPAAHAGRRPVPVPTAPRRIPRRPRWFHGNLRHSGLRQGLALEMDIFL